MLSRNAVYYLRIGPIDNLTDINNNDYTSEILNLEINNHVG